MSSPTSAGSSFFQLFVLLPSSLYLLSGNSPERKRESEIHDECREHGNGKGHCLYCRRAGAGLRGEERFPLRKYSRSHAKLTAR